MHLGAGSVFYESLGVGVFFRARNDVLHYTSGESEPSTSHPGHVHSVDVITL
jgi:hypothetical protein